MSAAFIQKCNKCFKPFVKADGCNKMTCSCGNLQCYICGENIKDYTHFDRGEYAHFDRGGAACPLWDESRLRTKVHVAHTTTVRRVLEEDARLTEKDVMVD
jgi:E3 ubiquitin-protein ligase RNF216